MVTRFNLILTGRVLSGHSREASAGALAALMQISPERAARLLAGRETVIRRDLAESQLTKYLEAVRATGAEARVDPAAVAATGAEVRVESLGMGSGGMETGIAAGTVAAMGPDIRIERVAVGSAGAQTRVAVGAGRATGAEARVESLAVESAGAEARLEAAGTTPGRDAAGTILAGARSPSREPGSADRLPNVSAAPGLPAAHAARGGAQGAGEGAGPSPFQPDLTLVAEDTMECPVCSALQPKRTLCRECGADMPRVLAARADAQREAKAMCVDGPAREAGSSLGARGGASPYAAPRSSVDEVPATADFATPHPLALSLNGRVGRLRYLAYAFPAYLPALAGGILGGIIGGAGGSGLGFALPLMLGVLITAWLALRTMVLRLHDLNRTGKWVLLTIALPVVAALTRSPALLGAFAVLVVLASLVLVILPGSAGGNDYGAPPGPNTLWTVAGAALMILLTVFSFVSGGADSFSRFGTAAEEPTAEELRQLEEFQRQFEEMQRRQGR